MKKSVYTTFDISRLCDVNITTVTNWINEGKLLAFKTPGGHRRVSHDDLIKFLTQYHMPIPSELAQGRKIFMVVDDEQDLCQIIKNNIQAEWSDVTIEIATDGFEAGRKIAELVPDLVLLDLKLPGIDGFEICKNIRKDEKLKEIKIIAMSGIDVKESKDKILAAGADDFLEKPFTFELLKKKIEKFFPLSK